MMALFHQNTPVHQSSKTLHSRLHSSDVAKICGLKCATVHQDMIQKNKNKLFFRDLETNKNTVNKEDKQCNNNAKHVS